MATLADFMQYVLPLVPGCPALLAERTLRDVAIDFCSHAPVVQAVLDPIDIAVDQVEYDLDTPNGTNVALVLDARYLGRRMEVYKSGDDPVARHDYSAAAYALRQAGDNTFTLDRVPTQAEAGAIVLRVSTRPSRTTNTLDDLLLADYGYEIGAGTAARLMLMPGQLFSDPKLAPTYQAIYLAARTEARIRAERSFGQAPTRVRPRPFI